MSDVFILDFPSYKSYLDSFLTKSDRHYTNNISVQRMLVKLNYRGTSKVYTAKEFAERKKQLIKQYFPQRKQIDYVVRHTSSSDPILKELAMRDRPNQQKLILTIIFIRTFNKRGMDISGFIDFEDSVRRSNMKKKGSLNWDAIFAEQALMRPKPTDLSYIDWYTGQVFYNNTPNFIVLHDVDGLAFMCRGDHKKIYIGKEPSTGEKFFTQEFLSSEKYGYITIFDHIVRKKF